MFMRTGVLRGKCLDPGLVDNCLERFCTLEVCHWRVSLSMMGVKLESAKQKARCIAHKFGLLAESVTRMS